MIWLYREVNDVNKLDINLLEDRLGVVGADMQFSTCVIPASNLAQGELIAALYAGNQMTSVLNN
jgi:hypothetical protein